MNKRRLLKLADLLEADAKRRTGVRFDLTTWGQIDNESKPVSCGTTACAMGLAAVSGAFKKQGLLYSVSHNQQIRISFQNSSGGFESACQLFGINRDAAHWLFDYPAYGDDRAMFVGAKGERMVARRIRNYVAGTEIPMVTY